MGFIRLASIVIPRASRPNFLLPPHAASIAKFRLYNDEHLSHHSGCNSCAGDHGGLFYDKRGSRFRGYVDTIDRDRAMRRQSASLSHISIVDLRKLPDLLRNDDNGDQK